MFAYEFTSMAIKTIRINYMCERYVEKNNISLPKRHQSPLNCEDLTAITKKREKRLRS